MLSAQDVEEEQLTPYQNWTQGELSAPAPGMDVGMRARSAIRQTGPGGTRQGALLGTDPAGGGLQYLGPNSVAGETRENREVRFFLARGEAAAAAHSLQVNPDSAKAVGLRPTSIGGAREPLIPGAQEDMTPVPMIFVSTPGGSRRNTPMVPRRAQIGTIDTVPTTEIQDQFDVSEARLADASTSEPYAAWGEDHGLPGLEALVVADGRTNRFFDGVSNKARTTVFQFIWELKLRAFTEGEILEQELRKDESDRIFLKLVQPTSMEALKRRKFDGKFWRALHYVDGTMPAWSAFCRRSFFLSLLDALLRGAGQNMMCNNPIGGAIAIGAIFATDAWIGVMACFGLLTSTLVAYFLVICCISFISHLITYILTNIFKRESTERRGREVCLDIMVF